MKIRFFTDADDFNAAINELMNKNDYIIVLKRADGFFYNKDLFKYFLDTNNIICTDDETMLNYVPFIDGKYNIEFKFPKYDKCISASELYPNLRKENNLMTMYHKRFFHDAFERYFK